MENLTRTPNPSVKSSYQQSSQIASDRSSLVCQRFVTVSGRRATIWDGKTGKAMTTLTAESLLGNSQADITAFSLDHQVDERCHGKTVSVVFTRISIIKGMKCRARFALFLRMCGLHRTIYTFVPSLRPEKCALHILDFYAFIESTPRFRQSGCSR